MQQQDDGAVPDDAVPDDAVPDEAPQDGTGRDDDRLGVGEVPDEVRNRLVSWAADALGGLPVAQVPAPLVRIARFAPAKRARLAGPALLQVLDDDAAFRAVVAEKVPGPEVLGADLAAGAARAVLIGAADARERVAALRDHLDALGARGRVTALEREIARLTDQVARLTADLETARARQAAPSEAAEADKLRTRLREQGTRMRRLHDELAEIRSRQEESGVRREADLVAARAEADRWRRRAEAADARAEAAARTVAELRAATAAGRRTVDDRRIELLLEAVEGAAAGLRREWQIAGGGSDPADLVAARLTGPPGEPGERTTDPGRLSAWLAMPRAHLLVDGYNVTKTGYPDLTLEQQRDRLVRSLAALAARTSADVTVVFDGAAVTTARPFGRRVRVLFSPPGVIADDVLRQLVAAEPTGRPLVVVSSDREVVESVGRAGARTAPSSVLLALWA